MKKNFLFSLITICLLFMAMQHEAQAQTPRYMVVTFGTVANSVTETRYVEIKGWSKLDSISVVNYAKGECDVDSVDFYVGNVAPGTNAENGIYGATAYTYTSTVNVDTNVVVRANLLTSNATLLTGAVLRGANALKIVTRGATSGNDPTDAGQNFSIVLAIHGTKD